MSLENTNWRIHLIEFFIVTLGILIGFGLNSWNETQKEEKLVQLYLLGIQEELAANKRELEKVHPYHLELLRKLREDPIQAILTLSPGEMTNSAWRLAENPTFKKHIDPSLYKELSAAYQMHEFLIEQSSTAGKLMSEANVLGTFYLSPVMNMELTEEDEREIALRFKEGWVPVFESWTATERLYLERIDNALALLN